MATLRFHIVPNARANKIMGEHGAAIRLIFALPPAELALHPSMDNFVQAHAEHQLLGAILYLMCDDLDGMIKILKSKNVSCTEIETAEWGIKTTVKLPSGDEIGLYQPTHLTPLDSGLP
jgi:hypothetical protein